MGPELSRLIAAPCPRVAITFVSFSWSAFASAARSASGIGLPVGDGELALHFRILQCRVDAFVDFRDDRIGPISAPDGLPPVRIY
jgi:hypothetical protein